MAKRANGSGNSGGRRSRRSASDDASSPPAGDNKVATPALIAEAVAQYLEDRAVIARAAAHCGANLARYEAQGVDPAIVKLTAAAMKLSQKEAAERHLRQTEYLVAAGAVLPDDLDWSEEQGAFAFKPAGGEVADKVAEQRAKAQGYKAGRKGHSLESNPYQHRPGSPEFVGWRDGLTEGLEDRKARKPDADHTVHASTARERREPPPKAEAETEAPADDAAAGTVH